MIDVLNKVIKRAVVLGPHVNKIEENKKRVYQLSRGLSDEQGYELINLLNETVEETKKLQEKKHELDKGEQ